MRLYWPKTEEPSILPIGKGTWQPPGIVQTKQAHRADRESAGCIGNGAARDFFRY
jgi:hypothetical protein